MHVTQSSLFIKKPLAMVCCAAFLFLTFSFANVVQAQSTCDCYCNGTPPTLTAAVPNTKFVCEQECNAVLCSGVPCGITMSSSQCYDTAGGGGTPGGSGTDQAETHEIQGVLFPKDPLDVKTGPKDWIRNAVEIVLQLVGAGAFLLTLYGGALILFARGEPKKVTEGKNIIVYAAIGLIVILFSYFMLNVIFSVLQGALTT